MTDCSAPTVPGGWFKGLYQFSSGWSACGVHCVGSSFVSRPIPSPVKMHIGFSGVLSGCATRPSLANVYPLGHSVHAVGSAVVTPWLVRSFERTGSDDP
ncbi:MAG: hypothetical protein B7Z66_15045 [Chromatiales bacterium 21-64-14]|nr:MAG: hypothetical protein B7Z66_15045 [Chromatiales bacterium 21-64-14]